MLSRTKVSKGHLTIVPKEIRKPLRILEGDVLEWSIEDDKIVVRPRGKGNVDDIIGIISGGGSAVESKRRAQRGRNSGG
jgi:AbrB family looped-hinge helix DNA binding protein